MIIISTKSYKPIKQFISIDFVDNISVILFIRDLVKYFYSFFLVLYIYNSEIDVNINNENMSLSLYLHQ